MHLEALKPDCASCAALCCIAPPFDAVQGFGFDKPACTPCGHLGSDLRCTIHAELLDAGFPGCVAFDCHGAGQRATRTLCGAPAWPLAPDTEARLFELYARLLPLHEQMALLATCITQITDESARLRVRHRLIELDALAERLAAGPAARVDSRAERHETIRLLREVLPLV